MYVYSSIGAIKLEKTMLHWFINEQVEEEKNAEDILDQLEMAGDKSYGIMFLDKHVLGARKGS